MTMNWIVFNSAKPIWVWNSQTKQIRSHKHENVIIGSADTLDSLANIAIDAVGVDNVALKPQHLTEG
jgi:hypothetical protein